MPSEAQLKYWKSLKGKPSNHKGTKWSKESRERLSKSQIGRHLTEETKKKISNSLKGRTKITEQGRKILSERMKKNNPSKLPYVRKLIKEYHTGKILSEEHKKKISVSNKGKVMSENAKLKISGKNSHLWKGGRTHIKTLNHIKAITQWRKKIFKRDKWICQITGFKGRVNAHHIKGFATHKLERYNIKNGITMKDNIHRLFHKIYGYKFFTEQNLEEFKNRVMKIKEKLEKEKEIDNYVDELCKKEITQEDKVDETVNSHLSQMGFLWDFTVKKLSEDKTCYECKKETSDKEQMQVIPVIQSSKGLVIFASICKECVEKLQSLEVKEEKKDE